MALAAPSAPGIQLVDSINTGSVRAVGDHPRSPHRTISHPGGSCEPPAFSLTRARAPYWSQPCTPTGMALLLVQRQALCLFRHPCQSYRT